MPNFVEGYWEALNAVIEAAWTDIPDGQLFVDTNIERFDWNVLMDAGEMSVPWVVVKLDIESTSEWCACVATYKIDATIWYITSLAAAAAQSTTASMWIASKLADLQRAFNDDITMGSTQMEMPIDISSDNPVNASFLEAKILFQAGSITISNIVTTQ